MSIDINKIQNTQYKELAKAVDCDKHNKTSNNNGYIDIQELPVFFEKINKNNPENKKINTVFALAKTLGFKEIKAKPNTRADYNLATKLSNNETQLTADNVVFVLTEYENRKENKKENKNEIDYNSKNIKNKLHEKAKSLNLEISKNDDAKTIIEKIKKATNNTYFIKENPNKDIDKIIHLGDAELAISETHYKNGKIILTAHGLASNGTTKTLMTPPTKNIMSDNTKKNENEKANDVDIFVPSSFRFIPNDIAKTLSNKEIKQTLMNKLDINNETYDRYAKLLTRISRFEMETFNLKSAGKSNRLSHYPMKVIKYLCSDNNMSTGATALKFNDIIDIANGNKQNKEYKTLLRCIGNNEEKMKIIVEKYKEINNLLASYQINEETDILDEKKSAIASLIFMHKRKELLEWICKNDSNPLRTCTKYHDLNSRLQTSELDLNEEKVLAWIWNGGFEALVDAAYTENEAAYQYAKTITGYKE